MATIFKSKQSPLSSFFKYADKKHISTWLFCSRKIFYWVPAYWNIQS